ncbi:hypothetical protein HIM_05134 [Hirsutella minnesotensis 3608]|uniref:Isotrichodermin C-15 hydroxylase n=1 Tax=Hirsutella minnesotensis 3608 TaxID=1043627 RepID=A0A0F7ZUT8_9HYPO|nr:hypothetical protein HIM_05134 [Hirsutella minnesotensis 3608]
MSVYWDSQFGVLRLLGRLLVAVLIYLASRSIYRVWFHPLSRFPGPKLLAVTAFPATYAHNIQGTWVRRVSKLHRKYGPVVRIGPNHLSFDGSIGWQDVFGLRTGGRAEYAKPPPIFKKHAAGLLHAPHDSHRRQRRLLNHAFSDAALKEQQGVILRYVDMLLDRLTDRADEEMVNVVDWFSYTTFDIIGDLAFSESFSCLENDGYHPWVLKIFKAIRGSNLMRFANAFPIIGWLIIQVGGRVMVSTTKTILSNSGDVAQARLAREGHFSMGHRDFMSYMLRSTRDGEKGMTEQETLINAPVLILAGSVTTATALSGFFFYLSESPRAYHRLVQEIRSAFVSEAEIDLNSTASLQYLQACISETLRVYPPAAGIGPRICPGDRIGHEYVPAGTFVSVHPWATFQNPGNFVEPEHFLPERWLPATHQDHDGRFAADNKAAFKPFSYGPRDCLGKNLALAEIRLIVCRILFRLDFELAYNQSSWHDDQRVLGLWDKGPLHVNFRRRDFEA